MGLKVMSNWGRLGYHKIWFFSGHLILWV